MIESAARRLASELVDRRESINRELSRNGVRFGIYKNGEYHDRLFPYDPIPRIIESDEFDRMEAGLKQRVNALNAYLRDIYSDKQAIKDGIVPEEYVYTSAGYFPQVNGVTPPGGVFAHVAGEDLVQGQDGQWWVLEDNLRIPSGASYPLFARDIERRITPSLFRNVRVRDNRDYPRLLRQSMDFVSTDGIAVVLTPGRYNSAFFEHAYLAEKTGAALAFPEDLEVVDNKVYFLDYAGRKHRVGVVYRRLSDEYLDPFAFNPDSVIGVPGILSAYRSGNVAIVNAPGNGAADDKAIYYSVPNMIRYYLGEEPILHNAPTYMPMFDKDRKEVLDRLGELVIKDVAEAGGYGVVFGSSLDRSRREELAERIKAEPRRFIAQEVIQFKDIDVVDPETGVEHDYAPGSEVVRVLEQSRKHSLALVTASKADNLFWLGRYTERVFTTLSQFFPFYDRVMDTDVDAFRPFARALDLPEDFEDFDAFIHSFLYDEKNPDSVRSAIVYAFNNAVILRPELGSRSLQQVELAMSSIVEASEYGGTDADIFKHRDIADNMLAFWGGVENSPVEPTLKSFIFVGKYLERLDLYTRFGYSVEELKAPLAKLGSYILPLNGLPVPQCFAEGLRWLVGQLPQRGYAELAEKLGMLLKDFDGRISTKDLKDLGMLNTMDMDAARL